MVGVGGYEDWDNETENENITAIVAPTTVTTIGVGAFESCTTLAYAYLPGVSSLAAEAFFGCSVLSDIVVDKCTYVGMQAFEDCSSLKTIILPLVTYLGGDGYSSSAVFSGAGLESIDAPLLTDLGNYTFEVCNLRSIELHNLTGDICEGAFFGNENLEYVDFGPDTRSSIPALNYDEYNPPFDGVPTTCKFIVPDANYTAWTTASGWSGMVSDGYQFIRYSDWECARKYELDGVRSAIGIPEFESTAAYAAGKLVLHDNAIWKSKSAISAGAWNASNWYRILELSETNSRFSYAVTIGSRDSGTVGTKSFTQGTTNIASGLNSCAQGDSNEARGEDSHAEGYNTKATNDRAHSEGGGTTASGVGAHAEGLGTTASGDSSHAEGYRAVTAASGYGTSATTPHKAAFAWQGQSGTTVREYYHSHGDGTFNINPVPASGQTDVATGFYIGEETLFERLRYAVVTKTPTVSSGTASITLDDYACNSASTTAATVSLTFPNIVNGRARDFLMLLDTTGSSSAPTIAYASYMTLVADEDADLTPIVGKNLYTFTEIARNTFVATRTTLDTIASQVPQDGQSVLSAASQAGYDMTNVNTPGQLATALGLTDSADLEDCANKVMFG